MSALSGFISSPSGKFSLRLPREHGAVAVFSLSTILSLSLCRSHPVCVASSLAILWLMMSAKHSLFLLTVITLVSAFGLQTGGHSIAAIFIFAIFCALLLLQKSDSAKQLWWREILGLAGACCAPLCMTAIVADNYGWIVLTGNCLLAGIMTGLALIHALRSELKVSPLLTASLSFVLWLSLANQNPFLTALCLFPFCMQAVWIAKYPTPDYKALGIAQMCSLSFSAVMLLLCR